MNLIHKYFKLTCKPFSKIQLISKIINTFYIKLQFFSKYSITPINVDLYFLFIALINSQLLINN